MSPDRTTVRIPSRVVGEGEALEARLEPVPAVRRRDARRPSRASTINALNNHLANDEIQELVNGGLDSSLRLTLPLTFLILLIAFGAVIAAIVPLVMADDLPPRRVRRPRPLQPVRHAGQPVRHAS